MSVRRIVPNVPSRKPDLSRDFYVKVLGLRQEMDMGWIATYVSPTNPTAQISIVAASDETVHNPTITVEVADVDSVHATAVANGFRIVYPLTNEPWSVRRFGVEDPNGVIINVMQHLAAADLKKG